MTHRRFINLTLAAVLGLLAGVIVLAPDPSKDDGEPSPFLSLDPSTVSHIRLRRGERVTLELMRHGEVWRIMTPFEFPGDANQIGRILASTTATVESVLTKDADPTRLGLEPPLAWLEIDDVAIALGDRDAINPWRYVAQGGRIALVADRFFGLLNTTAEHQVHPNPLAGERLLGLRVPGGEVSLRQGEWTGTLEGDIDASITTWLKGRASMVAPRDAGQPWQPGIKAIIEGGEIVFDFRLTQYELLLARRDPDVQYHFPLAASPALLGLPPPPTTGSEAPNGAKP